jgi:hypothetical protein
MNVNRLVVTIEATHQSLQQRLDAVTRSGSRRLRRPREIYSRTDAFLAATSRHLAAVDEVLVPAAAHRLPDGPQRVRHYLQQARLLEQAMVRLKGRLYGEQHAAYQPWAEVWEEVREDLHRHNETERALVGDLAEVLDEADSDELAEHVYRAEVKAPTRAHPYSPHTGLAGLVARRLWALADRFWDTAQARAVPPPVRPPSKEHSHDSLIAQYLVGEPLLDDSAPMLAKRRHTHRLSRS